MQSEERVAVSCKPAWRNPDIDKPPQGAKMLLCTWTGIATIGRWEVDHGQPLFAAWCELPDKPDWLKDKLRDKYAGSDS